MVIETVEASGLRGLAGVWAFEQEERLSLGWEARRALRHALHVPFALVDAAVLRALLADWGASDVELEGEPWATGARFSSAPGLSGLLEPEAGGLVRVRARLRLDPPQFATLRHHAARDLRLVAALAEGATCELAVGLLVRDGSVALDLHTFVVGGVSFPVAGPDRPAWLVPFLSGIRGRFAAAPVPPGAWGEAARSWSAEEQLHLRAATEALAACPDAVMNLLPLPDEPAVLEGNALIPVRFLPAAARAAVGWVGVVHLRRPDVLVALDAPSGPAWAAWWAGQVAAEQAAVEQVILLSGPPGE